MSSLSPTFRIARVHDEDAIRKIYIQVFERPQEAQFVEAIRHLDCDRLSLVAEIDGQVSAHLLASPVYLDNHADLKLMILEPMAVIPKCQGYGVGSAMVNVALEQLRQRKYDATIVIGLADYYPRFGFRILEPFGWQWPFAVDAQVVQVAPLRAKPLPITHDTLRFSEPFNRLFTPRD
ncbi:GNAT family N-acetyltransferase [Celerinatantimonas yamalensis]|uniref:N-acetyltransferase n=1 Tax=Celerinatantimonas yamalensis TaxID=559956 RepID=A0ABW9G9E4_9GAMM